MDYSFIYNFANSIMEWVESVGDIFSTTIGEMFNNLGLAAGVLGSFADVSLLNFMLAGGFLFIVGYTLAKWALPLV